MAPETIELPAHDRDELREAQERLTELSADEGARSAAEAEEADRLLDRIARGLMRPGDAAPGDSAVEDEGIAETEGDSGARGKRHGESDRLVEDLTAHRTAALRAIIGDDADAALTVLVHALALRLFGIGSEFETCLTLSAAPEDLSQHAEGIAATRAMTAVEERHRR